MVYSIHLYFFLPQIQDKRSGSKRDCKAVQWLSLPTWDYSLIYTCACQDAEKISTPPEQTFQGHLPTQNDSQEIHPLCTNGTSFYPNSIPADSPNTKQTLEGGGAIVSFLYLLFHWSSKWVELKQTPLYPLWKTHAACFRVSPRVLPASCFHDYLGARAEVQGTEENHCVWKSWEQYLLGSPGATDLAHTKSFLVAPWLGEEEAEITCLIKERRRGDLNNYLYFRQNGAFYYVMQIQIMDFFMWTTSVYTLIISRFWCSTR